VHEHLALDADELSIVEEQLQELARLRTLSGWRTGYAPGSA